MKESPRNYGCKIFVALSLCFCASAAPTLAETESEASRSEDGPSLLDLSLEELMNLSVTSTSPSKEQPLREASGIMSVITAEEIRALGARDLMEVLAMIPSLDLATDVSSVTGLMFRGQYGHNGRILVTIDGQIMTELAFATTPLGNNYPAQSIERIEIIRGPGSTNYGGFAELAVINVISKKPATTEKGELVISQGTTSRVRSRSTALLRVATKQDDVSLSAIGSYDLGIRSDRQFKDFYGNTFLLSHDGGMRDAYVNLSAGFKGLSLRYVRNNYGLDLRDFYFVNAPHAANQHFLSERGEVKYEFQIAGGFTGQLFYNYLYDEPWWNGSEEQRTLELEYPDTLAGTFFNATVVRHTGTATVAGDITPSLHLSVGSSYYYEKGDGTRVDGSAEERYTAHNLALYGQALATLPIGIFTLGTRYERNSNYTAQMVSRVGVTKTFDSWHAKLLYGESFRAPSYQNVTDFYDPSGVQQSIRPEKTKTWEVELGKLITTSLSATINLYTFTTKDAITYYYDPVNQDSYGNLGELRSRGIESEIKYSLRKTNISFAYAYYQVNNGIALYQVRSPEGSLINSHYAPAAAPHKAVIRGTTELAENIRWTSSLSWRGKMYGYAGLAADQETSEARSISPLVGVNSAVLFEKVRFPYGQTVDIQLGVNNILDQNVRYFQAYNSYHAPIPGMSREFYSSLRWHF